MGLFSVECKCGCKKKVQRGSQYFLEQSIGLKFGIEVVDAYYNNYLTRVNQLEKRIDVNSDLKAIKNIGLECAQMSNLMFKVAHDGPSGLTLSRKEVEKLNLYIVQFIWRMEDLKVPEIYGLRPHERMSNPQKALYTSFTRSLSS
jgi:hypothetical protein